MLYRIVTIQTLSNYGKITSPFVQISFHFNIMFFSPSHEVLIRPQTKIRIYNLISLIKSIFAFLKFHRLPRYLFFMSHLPFRSFQILSAARKETEPQL